MRKSRGGRKVCAPSPLENSNLINLHSKISKPQANKILVIPTAPPPPYDIFYGSAHDTCIFTVLIS